MSSVPQIPYYLLYDVLSVFITFRSGLFHPYAVFVFLAIRKARGIARRNVQDLLLRHRVDSLLNVCILCTYGLFEGSRLTIVAGQIIVALTANFYADYLPFVLMFICPFQTMYLFKKCDTSKILCFCELAQTVGNATGAPLGEMARLLAGVHLMKIHSRSYMYWRALDRLFVRYLGLPIGLIMLSRWHLIDVWTQVIQLMAQLCSKYKKFMCHVTPPTKAKFRIEIY